MGLTTDPSDPRLGHGVDHAPLPGQHELYLVLSPEEIEKGFVRPFVRRYIHAKSLGGCGAVTTMGVALCETYARDPNFYGATFCVGCNMHKRVGADGEFYWCHESGLPLNEHDAGLDESPDASYWKVGT